MNNLVIENKGEIEATAFSLMGASTKRDSTSAIGMFGTGSKYAIAVLLDAGIQPLIMSGTLRIRFGLQPAMLQGRTFNQVVMQVGNKVTPLSFTTTMGLHWTVEHALRELYSNAIDEGSESCTVYEGTMNKPGTTRIYIPYDGQPEVQMFYKNFTKWFIPKSRKPVQVIDIWNGHVRLFDKLTSGVRVYRRGVLVYSDDRQEALYDYDFDQIDVREDRTCDKYNVQLDLPYALDLATIETKRKVVDHVAKHQEKCLEGGCENHGMQSKTWAEALDGTMVSTAQLAAAHPGSILTNPAVKILPESWVNALTKESVGVANATALLTTTALKGYEVLTAEQSLPEHTRLFNLALTHLERAGVYDPRNAPTFQVFASNLKDAPWGEFVKKNDTVLLNVAVFSFGLRQVFDTLCEELLHRSSNAHDETREFQNAIFRAVGDVYMHLTGEVL